MLLGAQDNYTSRSDNNSEHSSFGMDTGIVQQPPTKRHLVRFDMRHAEGAPRAKRRFEKVAAQFENFSISNNTAPVTGQSFESSSDDDELIHGSSMGEQMNEETANGSTIEEPDDESSLTRKRLRLADELSEYLEKAKEHPIMWKKMMEESRVSEGALTVWRPPVPLSNPFDDPSMKGRINELSEDEDEIDEDGDVVIDDKIAHAGDIRPEVSYPDESYRDSSSTLDSIPSTLSSSPISSPYPDSESGYGNRIVEVADGGTTTDSSLEDDDAMEMD
ncbi:hypothetical protein PENTCL1PPCAC_11606 [Pristionchus entomophagus]|uniref:Uncharacterized protein n=1 Tax=Pristionchus entomophagus TaxID=358040 RepID=A0AAV5T1Q9_9BILA|nr:hypothetical protein PENTCL1PPCAC_11606 [Pristionchus entomophagus]